MPKHAGITSVIWTTGQIVRDGSVQEKVQEIVDDVPATVACCRQFPQWRPEAVEMLGLDQARQLEVDSAGAEWRRPIRGRVRLPRQFTGMETAAAAGHCRRTLPGEGGIGAQPVQGPASTPLAQLRIVNGTQLHLVNKEASIAAQVLTKVPVPAAPEEPVAKGGGSSQSGAAAPAASSSAGSSSSKPQTSAPPPPAAPGSADDDKLKVNPKFQSFDAYLRDRRFDTASLPGSQIYKTSRVTQNGMIKIPPAVSIKQQQFRHVDTLSVINVPEIENFIGYWQHHLLENAMQRVGHSTTCLGHGRGLSGGHELR
ncbi:unnamed protein product [Prorocentrum cordatum]|uniref:Uncharacterized protein n=1 Tax=Prorocentrum cordatum TaxID=2364126 RepID=A0ABN9WIJ1_9DINO|nr:unnamed protein product [Polarella glacialis]